MSMDAISSIVNEQVIIDQDKCIIVIFVQSGACDQKVLRVKNVNLEKDNRT